uniref:Uncharacterized protein n=1 Tax=viral metagenome TaxID=1070528 RepID=A0A6H1Z9Q9_9ZZZZ
MTFPGRPVWQDLAPDAAHRREQQKVADQRESLLTAEDIDRALEQGRAGVEYMRKNWGSMWRLPRYPMRLR